MIPPLIFGYVAFGVIFAVGFWPLATGEREIGPPGSEPALRFLVGLLWPLALVVAVVAGMLSLVFSVGGGFAALWRHWRAERIPRATAIHDDQRGEP